MSDFPAFQHKSKNYIIFFYHYFNIYKAFKNCKIKIQKCCIQTYFDALFDVSFKF